MGMDVDNSDKLTPVLIHNDFESKLVAAGKTVTNKPWEANESKHVKDMAD